MMRPQAWIFAAALAACGSDGSAAAEPAPGPLTEARPSEIVTLAMDVVVDTVAAEDAQDYHVGGHDIVRIAYDAAKVDPKTQRVPLTKLEHYLGGFWAPTDPADASALDLSSQPYRLMFAASVDHGGEIVALFEPANMRMAMLSRPDFHVKIAGNYTIDPTPLTPEQIAAEPPNAHDPNVNMPHLPGASAADSGKIVALDVDITIDQKDPDEMGNIGDHHNARVFYDPSQVDPMTHRVAVLHEQHTPALIPKHLNPGQMPMTNAWLDLSGPDIGYHFAAAPTVGFPTKYFILFDESTRRMTIYSQTDGKVLLAGPYTVQPMQFTGPDIDAVVATSDPAVPPWDTSSAFPDPSKP